MNRTKKSAGYIMWQGPSALDGHPIAVIATMQTSNIKTGNMIQVWIIRSDVSPIEASKTGADYSICGSCQHRHYNDGACYVNLGQAPLAIYRSFKKGNYPRFEQPLHGHFFSKRQIRLGAYGDPAAAPFWVMSEMVQRGAGHTAYTHQARHLNFDNRFLEIAMVSADTPKQALKYHELGAKTFRIALEDDGVLADEVQCLSEWAGLDCADCLLCDAKNQNVVVQVHGSRKANFKSKLIELKEVA